MTSEERVIAAELREMRDAVSTFGVVDSRDEAGPAVPAFDVVARLTLAADTIEALATEVEWLRTIFAQVLDDHIDSPQAVSHAEMRDTARACREGTWPLARNALHPQRPDEEANDAGSG